MKICQIAIFSFKIKSMFDYHKCFIENLKYYRRLKGISQAKLAEICDVSNGTIGNIECGITKPSFDLILQLSDALGIQPEVLFHSDSNLKNIENTVNIFSKEQLKIIQSLLNSSVLNVLQSLKNIS